MYIQYATSGGNIISLPKWGEFIFVLLLNLWNDQDYKKQTNGEGGIKFSMRLQLWSGNAYRQNV